MIGAFNSIYTALQGFLSRSFWFAAFLPVALFAALHAGLAHMVLATSGFFGIPIDGKEATIDVTLILLGLIVVAYLVQPLVPRLRGLLDGSLLSPWLHDVLRARRLSEARNAVTTIDAAREELSVILDLRNDAHLPNGRFKIAYRKAATLTAKDSPIAHTALNATKVLATALLSASPLLEPVKRAEKCVLEALAKNNPDPDALTAPATPQELEIARTTNRACDEYESLLSRCCIEAVYRFKVLTNRFRVLGASQAPRATAVGDARFITERYVQDVYQVDFDYLWPRLMVAMSATKTEDSLLTSIEQARAKVDFAVLSLALAATIPAVWLPLILCQLKSASLFLAIGSATPPILTFFYSLVFESQLAFGEYIKTAVDRSRFLVFSMLKFPEPSSRAEERDLWKRIAEAEADPRGFDIYYAKTSATAGVK